MAASATAQQKAAERAARERHVNLFDMPELMPGAQPSANPAQREEFHQRAVQLHRDTELESSTLRRETRTASGGEVTVQELEAMFPALDAGLVRALFGDAPTPQHAIETLLALSAATAEPVAGAEEQVPALPPLNVGVEDHEKFPSLTDGNGWQVGTDRLFERDPEEDLGSVWRDRAKAAKNMPAAKVTPDPAVPRRRPGTKKEGYREELDGQDLMTDYEYRHRIGQRREKARSKYGRGKGAGKGQATGAKQEELLEESEGEVEEEACAE
eukprot:CAMPEP_0197625492 /NCGR_PEP_ID=MMETSP1338-20131121/4849_1 /TAXON_ID=43686 ORGANISM="Pelagodinium beii, Strain RCC1491" /NCGR_SAMPLE_ID=MMETSP1338 /ASSEMBLY_ACC=CAM_ASM_000754 /LENGTH=269 /DNA_ID=CAMNT_0043195919 /DNA_START=17 /DNA_END=826 /DNA_ORIENTATION=-